jgi:hypothetical protein
LSAGTPVVLTVDQPTYADPQVAVCWSASLQGMLGGLLGN